MIVAFACIRTSIMYKCSGYGNCLEFTQKYKSQHKDNYIFAHNDSPFLSNWSIFNV